MLILDSIHTPVSRCLAVLRLAAQRLCKCVQLSRGAAHRREGWASLSCVCQVRREKTEDTLSVRTWSTDQDIAASLFRETVETSVHKPGLELSLVGDRECASLDAALMHPPANAKTSELSFLLDTRASTGQANRSTWECRPPDRAYEFSLRF
jgi:hypothetical protein